MKGITKYLKPGRFLKSTGLLLLIFLAETTKGYVPLDSLVKNATCIFEGTAISYKCFYGPDDNIYTANLIKITKIINGDVKCGNVEIVTVGGTVDSVSQWVSEGSLAFTTGSSGIFFCIPSQWPFLPAPPENQIPLCVYSDIQGFFPYGLEYALNPDPDDDSAIAFTNKGSLHFFTGHRAAMDSFQNIFGHGYINCGPPENDLPIDFEYYPNPVHDVVSFNIPGGVPADISIYDVTGRLVFSSDPAFKGISELKLNGLEVQTIQRINISPFRPGIYMGTAEISGTVYKFKIIKI